ncbi:hypothetical protein SERLA73DRAFT_141854 [Serpula lacrymans var. lacrymans S7.3]|uniref:Uncharacterized protein n=2 Tax=Serpula lacrymans var. lacrymans TaxID=341189 RepID=F8Q5H8_SERL3|nr:uncharacterized protein SERLADRAFT_475093 [Serpula lacrymans var. lacrymans S7.9]EGN96449.1 hypothetical protein SERLA73DRAFT_141854 [Serpula lacrymans var. lacrymans S7.3]EGO21996.1 hypothetical protein SERLADRAFT_475093 [Serpula lacrymans var. lacrymans S7.9]
MVFTPRKKRSVKDRAQIKIIAVISDLGLQILGRRSNELVRYDLDMLLVNLHSLVTMSVDLSQH